MMKNFLIALVLLSAACGGVKGTTTSIGPATTSTAPPASGPTTTAFCAQTPIPTGCVGATTTSTTTTSAPTTTTGAKVGDTVKLTTGSTLSVYSYESGFGSGNQYINPKDGNIYAAIDVEMCAGPGTAPTGFDANPYEWVLQMPDNSRVNYGSGGGKAPELHVGHVVPGDCIRGWINYQIPANVKPKSILLQGGSQQFKWAVP